MKIKIEQIIPKFIIPILIVIAFIRSPLTWISFKSRYIVWEENKEKKLNFFEHNQIKNIQVSEKINFIITKKALASNLEIEKINILLNENIIGNILIERPLRSLQEVNSYFDSEYLEEIIVLEYDITEQIINILGKNNEKFSLPKSIDEERKKGYYFTVDIFLKDPRENRKFKFSREVNFIFQKRGLGFRL